MSCLIVSVLQLVCHFKDMKREKPSLRSSHRVNVRESVTREGKTENNADRKGMGSAMVLYLKDQLIRAKVYLSLTVTRNNAHFIRELRQRIKETQRALGDATKDSELPKK